jgi:hypothetical protein
MPEATVIRAASSARTSAIGGSALHGEPGFLLVGADMVDPSTKRANDRVAQS